MSEEANEAYLGGKRGLFMRQRRPIYAAKEAYLRGKRGLFTRQKRPIDLGLPEFYAVEGGLECVSKRTHFIVREHIL